MIIFFFPTPNNCAPLSLVTVTQRWDGSRDGANLNRQFGGSKKIPTDDYYQYFNTNADISGDHWYHIILFEWLASL